MLDELDDGARTGVWVAIGVIALLLFGLIGGLALRQVNQARQPAAAPAVPAAPTAPVAAADDALLTAETAEDVAADAGTAIDGERVGVVYFAVGAAALPADAEDSLQAAIDALAGRPGMKALLSGYHDASGNAAMNAELAKARAKAVRALLLARGVSEERIQMRKPEVTTGAGDAQEARRVEVWLVE